MVKAELIKPPEAKGLQWTSAGILLILLINGLLIHNVCAGIGLKPLDFFRFSNEELGKKVSVIFHPDEGLRLRENYEKKYGIKGEELIKSLGEGAVTTATSGKSSQPT